MEKGKTRISFREFAKLKSVSDTAIRKMVRAGTLHKCVRYEEKNGKTIPYLLLEEANVEYLNSGGGSQKVERGSEIKKVFSNPLKVEHAINTLPDASSEEDEDNDEEDDSDDPESLYEAKRQYAWHVAGIKKLELEKLQGKLIEKSIVYEEQFKIGQILKTELQSVPDKFIDDIRACVTREEAYSILQKAINDSLLKLSQLNEETMYDNAGIT